MNKSWENCTDCADPLRRPCDAHWGQWCEHGHRLIEPVQVEHICETGGRDCPGCYPEGRFVDPWPCGTCTREDLEAEQKRMEEEYWEEMWNEYARITYYA